MSNAFSLRCIYLSCKVLYFILSDDDFEIKSKIYSFNLPWSISCILKVSFFGICFLLYWILVFVSMQGMHDHEWSKIPFRPHWAYRVIKADFHSVQNVARSIFSERFLLKCVKSTTANEICSAWLFVIQKKALAKSRSRDILHWMEIRL